MGPIWIPVLIKSMSNNKNRSVNIVKRNLSLAHHIKCIIKKNFFRIPTGLEQSVNEFRAIIIFTIFKE